MRLRAISALALTCALFASAPSSRAAEYAFTSYPLGVLAFGAGITPPPGTYVTDAVSFYSGRIGGNFD
ncbi:MAG: transporter, partial [Rhodomicrobium sp.]